MSMPSRLYRCALALKYSPCRDADTSGRPHFLTPDGLLYPFEAAGEFDISKDDAARPVSSAVQVRQEPSDNSAVISAVTQIAARLGTDRVTFGVGRADLVAVNGTPLSLIMGEMSTFPQVTSLVFRRTSMNSPGIQARQLRLRIKALFWRFRWRPEGTIHRAR